MLSSAILRPISQVGKLRPLGGDPLRIRHLTTVRLYARVHVHVLVYLILNNPMRSVLITLPLFRRVTKAQGGGGPSFKDTEEI